MIFANYHAIERLHLLQKNYFVNLNKINLIFVFEQFKNLKKSVSWFNLLKFL